MTSAAHQRLNRLLVAVLLAAYVAYVAVYMLGSALPYDYFLVMRGTTRFCFDNASFQYGLAQNNYYPAPFYVAFCAPVAAAEPLLRVLFVMAPALLALWLARGRAAVLVYPPLVSLVHIGQTSWLLLPLYTLAQRMAAGRLKHPPAWYGLALVPALFKPHIALPALLWVLWHWRRRWRPLALAGAAGLCLLIPAFILRPAWPLEWLASSRPLERTVVSLAAVPIQLGVSAPGVLALGLAAGAGLLLWLKRRRGALALYDWLLVYFAVSPFILYYDLVLLLPFLGERPKRLLVALTAGLVAWLFALMTGLVWDLCSVILLALLAERLWTRHRPPT